MIPGNTMRFRKLRIAWSLFWGVPCVLLIVLWVRSYSQVDAAYVARWHSAISSMGTLYIDAGLSWTWAATCHEFGWPALQWVVLKNDSEVAVKEGNVAFPISRLVLLTAAFAPLSWINSRFSVRTLLIITTLVAVWLGLAVYVARQ
jgi:hypothetical protein